MGRQKVNAAAEAVAYRQLVEQVLAARESGARVPCLGRYGANWTSDAVADQEIAVRGCLSCPVLEACTKFRTRHPQSGGVWAGQSPVSESTKRSKGMRR